MSAPADRPAVGFVPLRRNRDFRLLWCGQAASLLGSQTSRVAYPLLVLAMTGSPAKAGVAGFAGLLGYLLFPLPAGGLADRYDRKRIMIACDAIRLAAVGSIAVAGWAARISYPLVLAAGFAEGTATVFFNLAQRAALPLLVHPSQRAAAIGQNEARINAAQLAGPPLGGALYGLSGAAPFAADALSYVVSLLTLPFIKTPMQHPHGSPASRPAPHGSPAPRRHRSLRAELREGLAWTWHQPFLRYSALFAACVNVLWQVLTLGLIVLARHDGATSAEVGIIVGCMGAGGLAGALTAPWLTTRAPAGLTITGCMWIWAVLLGLLALVRDPLWLCPAVAVIGFTLPAWNVSVQTFRTQITPNQLLGRTSSVTMQIAWGTMPLGSLLAGFLLQSVSAAAAMAVIAAAMAVTAVTATAVAPVRDAGRRDTGRRDAGRRDTAPAAGTDGDPGSSGRPGNAGAADAAHAPG
jgi:predicted MFS family arabinose efflux permease